MKLTLSPPTAPAALNVIFVAPGAMRLPGLTPQLFAGYCQKTPPQAMPPATGVYVNLWHFPCAFAGRVALQAIVASSTIAFGVAPSPMYPEAMNELSTGKGRAEGVSP